MLSIFACSNSWAQAPEQDCLNAIHVCTDDYTQNTAFSGFGAVNDVPPGTSCLQNGEVNSVWYSFNAVSAGQLTVQLNPLNPNDDYDFAIYDLTVDSCVGIQNGDATPIRCNYSSQPGSTGLTVGVNQTTGGTSDPNQCAPLNVSGGDAFAMVVSNFTSSQTGYSLNFGGSASVVDVTPPDFDYTDLNGECSPDRVYVYFDEPILCSSVASNGSDFVLTSPGGQVVNNAAPINCVDGYTTQVRVRFNTALTGTGNHTLTIATGSDGNTILDRCGNPMPTTDAISFNVQFIGPEAAIVNYTDSDCGVDNGNATVEVTGGTAPIMYSWSAGPDYTTAFADSLGAGTWHVNVTDANGCEASTFVTLVNNGAPQVTINLISPISCFGATDAVVEAVVTGGATPYTYEWVNLPDTLAQVSGLGAGNRIVRITDANGCEAATNIVIQNPPSVSLPTDFQNPDCGQANGYAMVNASGGIAPYTYTWAHDPALLGDSAGGVGVGVYNITVTDDHGCSDSTTIILTNDFAPNATIGFTTPDCGQNSGSAQVLPDPPGPAYTFVWSDPLGQTTQTATGLAGGDYYVSITDANTCTQIINVKIDTVPEPMSSVSTTIASCGLNDGTATIDVSGGVLPYMFNWNPMIANPTGTVTDLYAGQYSVVVSDSIGCETSVDFTIEQIEPISSISVADNCVTENFQFNFSSDANPISTIWDFGDGTMSDLPNPVHSFASAGTYEVELQLLGGCADDVVTQTVQVFAQPTPSFIVNPEVVTTRVDAVFEYTGSEVNSFNWDLGNEAWSSAQNPIAEYPVEGFYPITLTVVDANGCSQTITEELEVKLAPALFFPNAFTPNGRTINSRFVVRGIGVTDLKFTVVDRWGGEVFFSQDLDQAMLEGWDGNIKGNPAPQSTYAYFVWAKFYDGTEYESNGTVMLIR